MRMNKYLPQMKQVFFRINSFCCFSDLRSAKVSIITPKMRFKTIIITMKKNSKSYTTLATNNGSWKYNDILYKYGIGSSIIYIFVLTTLEGARRISPIPPPFLNPWFSVVTIHMTSESHVRSFNSPPTLINSGLFFSSFTKIISFNKSFAYLWAKNTKL